MTIYKLEYFESSNDVLVYTFEVKEELKTLYRVEDGCGGIFIVYKKDIDKVIGFYSPSMYSLNDNLNLFKEKLKAHTNNKINYYKKEIAKYEKSIKHEQEILEQANNMKKVNSNIWRGNCPDLLY